jgi:hypothetical protein
MIMILMKISAAPSWLDVTFHEKVQAQLSPGSQGFLVTPQELGRSSISNLGDETIQESTLHDREGASPGHC